MDPENVELFLKWLDNELTKNNFSDYQFAAKAKISHTVISKARKENCQNGMHACQ